MTIDPLDQHLDALGDELGRGIVRADRRRRRIRTGAALGAALGAVGLGALVALPGGRDLDPVAEARAAVAQRGGILHYVYRFEFIGPHDAGRSVPSPESEVWTATEGPDRYRQRDPADGRPRFCGQMTFMLGPGPLRARRQALGPTLVSPVERSQDGRTSTTVSTFSRAAFVFTAPPRSGSRTSVGAFLTPDFGARDPRDPVRSIERALATGQLRDGGTFERDGRQLRRLVGSTGSTRRVPDEVLVRNTRTGKAHRVRHGKYLITKRPTQYTYLVDAETFAPVELRTRRWGVWSRAGGYPHEVWTTEIERFSVFNYLPDTPANRELLQIDLPKGMTVYRASGLHVTPKPPALGGGEAAERAAMRRCRAALAPGGPR